MELFSLAQREIIAQLVIAVGLGSLVGIERTMAHRLAGFRTFALVSLGACGFTIMSQTVVATLDAFNTAFDPSRIASQIVVGIGFLAGGLIVLNKDKVHGLTTSAGIWVAAAIGMAVGFKLYLMAMVMTVLTLLIFGLFWQLEHKLVARDEHEQS